MRILLALPLFCLTACGPTRAQNLALCQLEANRVVHDEAWGATGLHAAVCMRAKNYELLPGPYDKDHQLCNDPVGSLGVADCYRRIRWFHRLTGR